MDEYSNYNYGSYDDLMTGFNPDYNPKKDKKMEKELKKRNDNRKETKVKHWLFVDFVLVLTGVITKFVVSFLSPVLGVLTYLAWPLVYLFLFLGLAFVPSIPSGIRSRFEWLLAKILIGIIVLMMVGGLENEKYGITDKITEAFNEVKTVATDKSGHISNEEMKEIIKKNLAGENQEETTENTGESEENMED